MCLSREIGRERTEGIIRLTTFADSVLIFIICIGYTQVVQLQGTHNRTNKFLIYTQYEVDFRIKQICSAQQHREHDECG